MASVVIEFWFGEPRVGIWCDDCLTSARYECNMYRWSSEGPELMCTLQRCMRCRGDDDD